MKLKWLVIALALICVVALSTATAVLAAANNDTAPASDEGAPCCGDAANKACCPAVVIADCCPAGNYPPGCCGK